MYRGIKYFELYPTSTDKKLIINIDDSIDDINKKLKGIINKNASLYPKGLHSYYEDIHWNEIKTNLSSFYIGDYHKVQALKTDIKFTGLKRFLLRNETRWLNLEDYRYGALQLNGSDEIEALVLTDVDNGKVVTNDGEISIRNICVNTKLFGTHIDTGFEDTIRSDDILENIQIYLIDNMVCFIKYNPNKCLYRGGVWGVLGIHDLMRAFYGE